MAIGIDQRVPDLSGKELEGLHANAVRLAQSGTPVRPHQAEALLPLYAGAAARPARGQQSLHMKGQSND